MPRSSTEPMEMKSNITLISYILIKSSKRRSVYIHFLVTCTLYADRYKDTIQQNCGGVLIYYNKIQVWFNELKDAQ